MLDGSSSESSDDLEERTSDSMATKQKEPEEDFGDEDSPLENAAKDLLNEMPLGSEAVQQLMRDTEAAELEDVLHSYRENSQHEKLVLQLVANFQSQFRTLFPDRMPLLLTPLNEFNCPKFVCCTIRPTAMPFSDLNDFKLCARFVADYLTYIELEDNTEVPTTLVSPTRTLNTRRANSFDASTLLCSMLIGAGYDACVVNGYATKEITQKNLAHDPCPLLQCKPECKVEQAPVKKSVYARRAPPQLVSAFETRMRDKAAAQVRAVEEKAVAERLAERAEKMRAPVDELEGVRVHAWVLVRAGRRGVEDDVFIEATTGRVLRVRENPEAFARYLGVEAVWNHENYWVNMQDCSDGIGDMQYRLDETAHWEHCLAEEGDLCNVDEGEDIDVVEEEDSEVEDDDEDVEDKEKEDEAGPLRIATVKAPTMIRESTGVYGTGVRQAVSQKINASKSKTKKKSNLKKGAGSAFVVPGEGVVRVPHSWVSALLLPRRFVVQGRLMARVRVPVHLSETGETTEVTLTNIGSRRVLYCDAKVEEYAEYTREDGLVQRLTVLNMDHERDGGGAGDGTSERTEVYAHRADLMVQRWCAAGGETVRELFGVGAHVRGVRELERRKRGEEVWMRFDRETRADGLMERLDAGQWMEEKFCGAELEKGIRRLVRRRTEFGRVNVDDEQELRHDRHDGQLQATRQGGTLTASARPSETSKHHQMNTSMAVTVDGHRQVECIEEEYEAGGHGEGGAAVLWRRVWDWREGTATVEYVPEKGRLTGTRRVYVQDKEGEYRLKESYEGREQRGVLAQRAGTLFVGGKRAEVERERRELGGARERAVGAVVGGVQETMALVEARNAAWSHPQLTVSFYDVDQSDAIKEYRVKEAEEAATALQRARRKLFGAADDVEPYLVRRGVTERQLTQEDFVLDEQMACDVFQECLADCKQRQLDKARIIQERLEEEIMALQQQQTAFSARTGGGVGTCEALHEDQADASREYVRYCDASMFRIQILEQRLVAHKSEAARRYTALERKIQADPRFVHLFQA